VNSGLETLPRARVSRNSGINPVTLMRQSEHARSGVNRHQAAGWMLCIAAAERINSGIGFATNNSRHGFASQRAQRVDFDTRALSVAMPVLAYICR
jgi:hypothetical protein